MQFMREKIAIFAGLNTGLSEHPTQFQVWCANVIWVQQNKKTSK